MARNCFGVGFNGRDAAFLSSIAKRLPAYGFTLTRKQLPHVRRSLKKYTRQLLEIIEAKGGKVDFKKLKKVESKAPADEAGAAESTAAPVQDRREQFGLF